MSWLTNFLNDIIAAFAAAVGAVLSILPSTPFNWEMGTELGAIWDWVIFFIPVAEMIVILQLYVAAVAGWYVLRWLLRFVRYIG